MRLHFSELLSLISVIQLTIRRQQSESPIVVIISTLQQKKMIEKMTTSGTIRLLAAIRKQAVRDQKVYGKRTKMQKGDYISNKCYESAAHYLDVEVPVIREVLGECFKD